MYTKKVEVSNNFPLPLKVSVVGWVRMGVLHGWWLLELNLGIYSNMFDIKYSMSV